MPQLILFLLFSAGIIYVSWSSFRARHTYAYYRFAAWEVLLVLILLNLEPWFNDPFSTNQLISWTLFLLSIVLAAYGFYLLSEVGEPEHGIQNTTILVSVGAYKYIRHPLYTSLLVFTWGVFFKDPNWLDAALALLVSALLFLTARAEEEENVGKFGAEYSEYMKQTRMFIPFLI
jgi:protein-S-isoprenylcysteine O-methyltransferase Ste14